MEESSKITRKRNCDQVNEKVQLEPQSNVTPRVAVSHQRGSKMSRSAKTEKAVRQRPQGGEIPLKVLAIKSKGEGWLPFPKNSLTNAMFFYDESDEDASHLYEELLCSQSSIDAASEKIKVTSYSSDEEESLGQSLFGFGDDLEMVNASNSTWKNSEGLEMCDSSRPVVVHEDFAGLWDNMSPAVNKFLQGCIITCYALQSLSLYGLKQEEPESQIKEEGEGWMPISGDEQVKNDDFKCTAIAEDEVYPDEEWFCEQSSIYATKEVKLEEMQVPTSKQSLVCSGDDLEMVDASNSRRKIGEGLEMCDSSRPSLVSNAFAMSWDSKSVQAILLHEDITISETIGERDLATINKEAIKEEEDDWGFDEPICTMEATIQANVDKAMERIAASRPTKLDNYGVPNEDSDDTSMQKHIVSFDAFGTTSRLWSILQVFKEPFQRMGARLERIFELRRAHEYLCNILMGCKLHMHARVVWDLGLNIWDPGGYISRPLSDGARGMNTSSV